MAPIQLHPKTATTDLAPSGFEEIMLELEAMLERRQESQGSVETIVGELQRQIEDHFQDEESGGYFRELLVESPQLRPKVADLLLQHGELRHKLSRLCERVFEGKLCQSWWDEIQSWFGDFQRQLREHERKEHELFEVVRSSLTRKSK